VKRRVLVLQAGSVGGAVADRFGDFDAWFRRRLSPRVETEVARPFRGDPLPSPSGFDGFLVTGALESATTPAPWMEAAGRWLLEAARAGPVLGVCFGHQLIARALGGRVERTPAGFEAGTREVRLTDAGRRDPLLAGLPDPLPVQQTHEDHVPEPPPGAVLLAGNAHAPVQAYAVGESIRCVQFHPEIDAPLARFLAERGRARLDREVPGGAAGVLAGIRETPAAASILDRWVERFVERRAAYR
jgi:GMP synthase (glutamine-hydrolysing)